jgi:hypothetical protein
LHHAAINIKLQKFRKDLAAIVNLPLKEFIELSLRQHYRFREAIEIQANNLLNNLLRLAHSISERLPLLSSLLDKPRIGLAALSAPLGFAGNAVLVLSRRKFQHHLQAITALTY